MSRRMFAAVAIAAACAAAPAFAQTNVAGDWDVTINTPQGVRTALLTLKQDGEKISGMFKSPTGELPVTGTMTGSDLKFGFTVPVGGQSIDITISGKVADEAVTGTADFGGFGEGDVSMKRATAKAADATTATATASAGGVTATASTTTTSAGTPTAATTTTAGATTTAATTTLTTTAPSVGAAGQWDVIIKTAAGEVPTVATVAVDGDKLSGTITGPMGDVPFTGTIEGKTVKLSMTAKMPQGEIPVTMTGDLDGDTIVNGKADVGGMLSEWTAKRKQP